MGADWTSAQRNAVGYGYRWPSGAVDHCANDAYSIMQASLDGLGQMGVVVAAATPSFSAEYLNALAGALDSSRDAARNASYATACRATAAAAPGTPVPAAVLQAVLWSAYYFEGDNGATGAGTPASVVLDQPLVAPAVGATVPTASNGQFNDAFCTPGGAAPPGAPVAGWSPNVLLVLGLIVGGGLVVNAINARTPRGKSPRK